MKAIKYGTLLVVAGCAVFALVAFNDEPDKAKHNRVVSEVSTSSEINPGSSENSEQLPKIVDDEDVTTQADGTDIVEAIRADYGASIDHGHTQVKALEKLVGYLKDRYPDSWEERLQTFLELTFPEYAEELMSLYQNMESYNLWMVSEKQNLVALSPLERRQLIWEMRNAFFGDVAQQIWEDSLKGERVLDTLIEISETGDEQSFADNGSQYVTSLKQAYGEEAEAVIESKRQELSDHFFSVPVVQEQLKAMPREDRYAALSSFRRSIGMDEEAVSRWTELDQKRDARREAGNSYLQLKTMLKDEFTGDDLRSAMTQLQDELFGEEAEIIRNEEDAGYFRFERPQVIGRN